MSALHNPVWTMKCLINKTKSGFANHSRIVTESATSSKCNHHLRGDFSCHMRSPQWCTLLDMTAFPRSGRLVVKIVRFTITARVSLELAIMLIYTKPFWFKSSEKPRFAMTDWSSLWAVIQFNLLHLDIAYLTGCQSKTALPLTLTACRSLQISSVMFLLLAQNCSYFRALRNSITHRGNFDKNKERK